MKEKEFISIIQNTLQSKFIGDDCAYLKDLGIVVTQDSLVEDVHFLRKFITPYQLGKKSVAVNLSDIAASGAKPCYLTISLSLSDDIDNDFIKSFYEGAKSACPQGVEIVGGDITGGDKIYISVCAIGAVQNRNISSRKTAQIGQKVIVSGVHGSSAAGLKLLLSGKTQPQKFIKAHLDPTVQIEFAQNISQYVKENYAMTDTSDGLLDALSNIANESNVVIDADFDKIPYDKDIMCFPDWQDLVLFGGEDYQIVATVPQNFEGGVVIGQVKQSSKIGVNLKINGVEKFFTKADVENKIFNHWRQK